MVYTCAYYRRPDADLAQAQRDKLDLICRKLELQPGESLLDLGCGWGGLAIWAARHHQVRVHAITLSAVQAAYARAWVAREGLQRWIEVEERDCLDPALAGPFDKVAGIGVTEHLGVRAHPAYFAAVHRLLRPGGLFLHHGITQPPDARHSSQWDFLIAHVFPGGDLTYLGHTAEMMECARLEVLDVECLRAHYARTTRQWAERLRAAHSNARGLVSPNTYRTWLLYLTAASVAFERGWIGLSQILSMRHDPMARVVPLTREPLYLASPPGYVKDSGAS